MARRSSNAAAAAAAAIATLAFCLQAVTAYPALMERVPGDNNYLPVRNSPSRDFDRFIGLCDDDDDKCGLPSVLAVKRGSLDRLNGGHTMVAKRGSLDRLNGGHTMVAKRGSLDRLDGNPISFSGPCTDGGCDLPGVTIERHGWDRSSDGGHSIADKRDSLDRLGANFLSFSGLCDDDQCALPAAGMVVKRGSLDRLNGGHTMVAKRGSLDRLNGGHTMVAKRDGADRPSAGHATASRSGESFDGFRDTVDRLGSGGPLSVYRSSSRPRPKYLQFHHQWTDFEQKLNDNNDFYYIFGDDCVGCSTVQSSSS